jgi:hypothetical protein
MDQEAVPWGRSFGEYSRMFHLTTEDLTRNILGCADGVLPFVSASTECRNEHLYERTGKD